MQKALEKYKINYPSYLQTSSSFFFFFFFFFFFLQFWRFFFSFSLAWEQKFQNATPITVFIRHEPDFYDNIRWSLGYCKFKIFGDLPKIKHFMFFFFLSVEHMSLGISKRYTSHSFHPISPEVYECITYHRRLLHYTTYRLLLFLVMSQVLIVLWDFDSLTWGSVKKS